MHELSLAENMLELIQEQAQTEGFSKVNKVILEIGELSHVEADAMRFCFDSVVSTTLADGALLEILSIPSKAQCPECSTISSPKNLYDPCPTCGSFGLDIIEGDQVRIKSLEVS